MGLLVDGKWQDKWYDTQSSGGRFERSASQFRHWVSQDGSKGVTGKAGFKAESGRYHLYVSYACPWAHRALVMRALKGLEKVIDVSVVHPLMLSHSWEFRQDFPAATGDQLYGLEKLYELYLKADAHYSGRVTVPVLWDKQNQTIVSNESADIIRMLNHGFDALAGNHDDYSPDALLHDIDAINEVVYANLNNGVYRAGFATTQEAYDEAVSAVFQTLEQLEKKLGKQRYLVGKQLTEADIRLWTTLVRFDAVYATHFKCNRKRIVDLPNLYGFLRDIYQRPGVAETVHMDHICTHYYGSHPTINPYGIIPIGPELDFDAPHERAQLE